MIRHSRLAGAAGLALLISGCAGPAIPRATPPRTAPPAPDTPPPIAPRIVQNNALIGHDADAAIGIFGRPRLDVTEGSGRKLQFSGEPCILDVYYYPPKRGAKPLATHVDARAPNGRDVDVDRCIAALRH